jgi:hypothetical protein
MQLSSDSNVLRKGWERGAMQATLPLEKMTVSEKLRALEDIWDDLCYAQDSIPSPEWHADVLHEREQKIKEGTAKFLDLAEANRKVWDQVK